MPQRIGQKLGMDQAPAAPNMPSTAKRKGFNHRMKETGAFAANAYGYETGKLHVRIFVKDSPHPNARDGQTYEQIGAWNQKDHPEQAAHIPLASKHFGITEADRRYWEDKILEDGAAMLDDQLNISGSFRMEV